MKLKRKVREAPIPYIPMADLAFNLLIFFLVLAKAQQDTQQWVKASSPGVSQVVATKVVVTITKPNEKGERKVYLNNDEVGVRELADRINAAFGDGPQEKRTVLLKVDKGAPAAIFEPVMEAISQAGAEVFHALNEAK